MNEAARNAQREYQRAYRAENREKIRDAAREWRRKNPDKCKMYRVRYWEKRAENSKRTPSRARGEIL